MGPCQEALAGAAHLLNWVWVWSRLPRLAPSQQHSWGVGVGVGRVDMMTGQPLPHPPALMAESFSFLVLSKAGP